MLDKSTFLPLILLLVGVVSKRPLDPNCFVLDRGLRQYEGDTIFDMEHRKMNVAEMETDNDFQIMIRRYSDGVMTDGWYESNTQYAVEIKNRHELIDFKDYMIWLEPSTLEEETDRTGLIKKEQNLTFKDLTSLGHWVHLPPTALLPTSGSGTTGTTRVRIGCRGLVAERNIASNSKNFGTQLNPRFSRVLLNWKSPSQQKLDKTGRNCIAIVASVQTSGLHATIYANMGGLRKIICPTMLRPVVAVLPVEMLKPTTQDPNIPVWRQVKDDVYRIDAKDQGTKMDSMQPKDCCACGTATYKLTFRGNWNAQTHPKDWPHKRQDLLHWTNLIGVSHMPSYSIYKIGGTSSAGVSPVCTFGDTTILSQQLERDVREKKGLSNVQTGSQRGSAGIAPILSLISAPGMWTPESMNESRTLFFAVNRTHPVFSMLTMMGPSPDWCTGVSGQSLCRADCSWIKKMEINLFPWDAGVVEGDTYIPPRANRHVIPEPIMYINQNSKPGNPFSPDTPVAKIFIERVKPEEDWQCTNEVGAGAKVFNPDGTIQTILTKEQMELKKEESKNSEKTEIKSASSSFVPKKRRKGSNSFNQAANTAGSGGLGPNNPLNDPALANMATFLCKVSDWSAWSQCSTTCGIGNQMRTRQLIVNKKNELCQHLPLKETKTCDGIQRVCDYSAPCALLRWSDWTSCNATCEDPENGVQVRSRNLARLTEREMCTDVLKTEEERTTGRIIETKKCSASESRCDPVAICGEGRSDGVACGDKIKRYHYSAEDHACLPFDYLGCKGNRNSFATREKCEKFCFKPIEALPQWRRERMVLLQYRTSDVARGENTTKIKPQEPSCKLMMDAGNVCDPKSELVLGLSVKWYFSKRNNRCREFVYHGCDGNDNRFDTHEACMEACMPEEVHRAKTIEKARKIAMKTQSESSEAEQEIDPATFGVRTMVRESQDCVMSKWGGWGPCSVKCWSKVGIRMRSRRIVKPSRLSGKPCGLLYEQESCFGFDESC